MPENPAAPGAPYPLGLRVTGRLVVVVGGGPVAARRARGLADAGARVRVVAPEVCEELAAAGEVEWIRREYRTGDLDEAWLAHTATGDPSVDRQVADDAEALRIFCVTAGDAEAATAWTPAVARVRLDSPGPPDPGDAGGRSGQTGEEIIVSVHAGGDPRRARAIRSEVQAQLESGTLPIRRVRPRPGADRTAQPATSSGPAVRDHGWVALVGGGPGDPGLISVRGRSLVARADVVVADRLGPRSLLDELAPDVQVVEVGKTAGNHPVPQDEINRILVQHAMAGRNVVRLKGGDPYVFGRGGEELAVCRDAGIETEVVPGVTSAVSVPAAVGIPVTHRGVARGFSVLTGHDALQDARRAEAGDAAAGHAVSVTGGSDHTLILLMGVSRLAETAAALTTPERPAGTPVAVVEDGYGPRRRVTVGTLADIAERAAAAGVRPPAVVVVGDVVRLAPAWRDHPAG
ncbi:uroporphyrinogen-III C-methyltransferase [Myceligenerans indicum]|uniref:Uroporphyrinogen-III C-methyltransferase n=1 Tax=Myceligenerans indicum TaxID=2593663 RepID=A0ABS1LEJ9_9MICO|nr:uroporphyrinogen-III C-methyltransferase [Myceligenerans indicum]MBL0884712.1 uroporphyrinogen-III C-methyltransferase [Myceligenerans indicum]